jgi:hypothetical protein
MMKVVWSLCLIFLFHSNGIAGEIQATDQSVPFLYESRAEIQAPDHQLATILSSDYRKARDEFTKHDLFQNIKPVLEKRLNESKQTEQVYLRVGGRLEDYDFEKQAFPTGIGEGTFIPYQNGYAISFINSKDVSYLPISLEKARALSDPLRKDRRTSMVFHCTIVKAKEQKLNWNTTKNLQVKINELDIDLNSGESVGSVRP